MARSAGTLGRGAAALVALALLAPLVAVIWRAGGIGGLGPADLAALRFTLVQSALSAVISVAAAIPLARALARRRFPGRRAIVTLLGAPFILPVIVAALALLSVFGRAGVINDILSALHLPGIDVYGLHGVVLAHVFLNMPLATRILLQGWQAIPAERFRLAAALDFSPRDVQRLLEWPMLRALVPGALMIIFAICLSSFAVVLIMGGGPSATTLELAIYQAFRFDFDLGRAATLSMVQLALVSFAVLTALWLARADGMGAGLDRGISRFDANTPALRAQDAVVITLACLFLVGPMVAVVVDGVRGMGDLPVSVWPAVARSIAVALTATALTMALALPLSLSRGRWPQVIGSASIAASPLVLGTGAFLILNRWVAPQDWALVVTAIVNALMALPFALRVLSPRAQAVEADFGRLADALNLTGWARMRWLILPRLRRPLGFSAGLAAALSAGDLGVIALFSAPGQPALPLLMVQLMGSYRTEAAAAAALVLVTLALGLFYLFDRGGGRDADA